MHKEDIFITEGGARQMPPHTVRRRLSSKTHAVVATTRRTGINVKMLITPPGV